MTGVVKGPQRATIVTVANGQSLSPAVDLGNLRLCGLETPASIDGATSLTFQASADGATYLNLYDATGTEKTITVSTSRRVLLAPADFYGIRWIKVRLGTSGTPVAATADRAITVVAEG